MSETDDTGTAREAEALRRTSNMLCLWRLCGNAGCRRSRACRGRAHLCGKRNSGALPKGARDFFELFLAAKLVGLPFEDFREDMEGREETKAFSPGARRPMPRPDDPHALKQREAR